MIALVKEPLGPRYGSDWARRIPGHSAKPNARRATTMEANLFIEKECSISRKSIWQKQQNKSAQNSECARAAILFEGAQAVHKYEFRKAGDHIGDMNENAKKLLRFY
jgi:hypothetical protein